MAWRRQRRDAVLRVVIACPLGGPRQEAESLAPLPTLFVAAQRAFAPQRPFAALRGDTLNGERVGLGIQIALHTVNGRRVDLGMQTALHRQRKH